MALNQLQYETIMKTYQETRERNRHEGERRLQEVYERVEHYQELDASTGSISAAFAEDMIAGVEGTRERLHQTLEQHRRQKHDLLTAAGYPADYLAPIYSCPHCQDTGYLPHDGNARAKCHCFRRRELALLYEQSNIQNMIENENFNTLSYEYYEGEDLARFKRAVEICRNFVQNFKQDYHNLFFYGTVGTGKSFLSGCIAGEVLKCGYSVIYFSAVGLFDTLARLTFDTRDKSELSALYEDLYGCDLVIIDDLGTELTNSFVTSQLFSCLNERHLRRKATIISTNLGLEELRDRYSDRVFSRITSNYQVCKLTGPDVRMLRKRKNN
ncbi:MAG: ATP-binding protein [Lachnospiraceae bacterium]|nr:ATP-binding protein [Lachnospiraceae bacterium]